MLFYLHTLHEPSHKYLEVTDQHEPIHEPDCAARGSARTCPHTTRTGSCRGLARLGSACGACSVWGPLHRLWSERVNFIVCSNASSVTMTMRSVKRHREENIGDKSENLDAKILLVTIDLPMQEVRLTSEHTQS